MVIECKMTVEKPNNVNITLTMTMPLADWKDFREQIKNQPYPSWKIRDYIYASILKVEREFEIKEADLNQE